MNNDRINALAAQIRASNQAAREAAFAAEAAARHRIPKATVTHPAVLMEDKFMQEKLKDPDYVPYCGPCTPMNRLRRTKYGFQCPACHRKSNFDLTKFNGNVDVVFAPGAVLTREQHNAIVDAKYQARLARRR